MKFLVDECVGNSVAQWLKDNNYAVVAVKHVMPQASDDVILEKAFAEGLILITCDKDFGEMIFKQNRKHAGVILLRLVDERMASKITAIQAVFSKHSHEIEGNFIIATDTTIRVTRFNN